MSALGPGPAGPGMPPVPPDVRAGARTADPASPVPRHVGAGARTSRLSWRGRWGVPLKSDSSQLAAAAAEVDSQEDQNRFSRTVAWLRLTRPDDAPDLTHRDRVLLRWEIIAVFAVSLGASGLYAFISLIGSLTASVSLHSQSVTLNGTQAPGRPLLDLFLQLDSLASGVAPVLLALYLLARAGDGAAATGVDGTQPRRDFLRGATLAALIGLSG